MLLRTSLLLAASAASSGAVSAGLDELKVKVGSDSLDCACAKQLYGLLQGTNMAGRAAFLSKCTCATSQSLHLRH